VSDRGVVASSGSSTCSSRRTCPGLPGDAPGLLALISGLLEMPSGLLADASVPFGLPSSESTRQIEAEHWLHLQTCADQVWQP